MGGATTGLLGKALLPASVGFRAKDYVGDFHSWEQTTVEFTVDYIGCYNPEEELGALGLSTVSSTVNNFVESCLLCSTIEVSIFDLLPPGSSITSRPELWELIA